jgi:nicotinate phosphoribosyltransferase
VYKLVRYNGKPKLKVTSDLSKSTIPDRKKLFRAIGTDGSFLMDVICRENETPAVGDLLYDPRNPQKTTRIPESAVLELIRSVVMEDGVVMKPFPSLGEMADRCQAQLESLPDGVLRFEEVLPYSVYLSRGLHDLRMQLIEQVQKGCR